MAAFSIKAEMPGGVSYADFDKRVLKRELRTKARPLVKAARQMVSEKGGASKPDTFPHRQSGKLRKEVKSRVSKSGFSFAISESGKNFPAGKYYPAFVFYGHRAPGTETKIQARQHRKRAGVKVAAPRKNWIFEASETYANTRWQSDAGEILTKSLKTITQK